MQKVVCEGVGLRGVNLVFGIAVCVHGAVWAGLQRKYKKLEFFGIVGIYSFGTYLTLRAQLVPEEITLCFNCFRENILSSIQFKIQLNWKYFCTRVVHGPAIIYIIKYFTFMAEKIDVYGRTSRKLQLLAFNTSHFVLCN